MKSDRYFYSAAAASMLLLTFLGFHPFYLGGEGMGGRKISPQILPLVAVHGGLMTAWVILFLVQSLLITVRNTRLHMKLGWVGAAIAIALAISGVMVAVASVRLAPNFPFWGMAYRQFLLIMLSEQPTACLCSRVCGSDDGRRCIGR